MTALAFAMPRARRTADDLARDLVARFWRVSLVIVGLLIVVAGVLIAPLPGPMGLPVMVVGLMLILRNSFKARKHFVRFQHAHPRLVFPIRRLLRREPEVFPVAWQQVLRVERLVAPARYRVASRWRKALRRRATKRATR
ncbi:PGPGW domain-containing protein [uncultured Caulobacter sp.]|uniref:PGPGW domain-containing protein n=1 Tax=uncultured Caulobacter sp. TaxID=158749 RepID=UPI00260B773A|nr:PGPGW domain-containing protein [uncultured Caulobacter sp.]